MSKITCQICGAQVHAIATHLKSDHPEWTTERYVAEYPDAPTMSDVVRKALEDRKKAEATAGSASVPAADESAAPSPVDASAPVKRELHKVFELGTAKAAMNARGEPIFISVYKPVPNYADLVPEIDDRFIFNIDLLKTVIIGLELNIPTMLWGHTGVGKTTILEQVHARTGRAFLRVQHTVNTEEAHITGQWVVKNGETQFEYGPLAIAMINGLTYCADEYDFAMAAVLAVYQPVLEGKPLVIKEAPAEKRVVRPHPNFRFVATGNTNGSGDETGLYQGTSIQNAANYRRFGIVEKVVYMPVEQERTVLVTQTGIAQDDAKRFVDFATEIRKAYDASQIGNTIGPAELINAAKLGLVRGSDWRAGLRQAYMNRLAKTDYEVADRVAQRVFG